MEDQPGQGEGDSDEPLRRMLRARRIGLGAFLALGAVGWCHARLDLSEALTSTLPAAYALLAVVLTVAAVLTWINLYRAARAAGGAAYAREHLLLSMALTPVLYVGVLVLPLVLEGDIEKGVARLRNARAARWWQRGEHEA